MVNNISNINPDITRSRVGDVTPTALIYNKLNAPLGSIIVQAQSAVNNFSEFFFIDPTQLDAQKLGANGDTQTFIVGGYAKGTNPLKFLPPGSAVNMTLVNGQWTVNLDNLNDPDGASDVNAVTAWAQKELASAQSPMDLVAEQAEITDKINKLTAKSVKISKDIDNDQEQINRLVARNADPEAIARAQKELADDVQNYNVLHQEIVALNLVLGAGRQ